MDSNYHQTFPVPVWKKLLAQWLTGLSIMFMKLTMNMNELFITPITSFLYIQCTVNPSD